MSTSTPTTGLVVLTAVALSGCNTILLHPSGSVAAQQGHLIVQSTVLMLIIVLPVIILTAVFAWRYRQSNTAATYTPDWDHSTQLELVIWAAPLLIIIALGALTWISSHTLDPYRPLRRLDAVRAVAGGVRPLTIEVVALDWKWLFIYPEQGIAVVNEVAAPVDVPINFKITASAVMNSFFVPALAGQVYAMPGMQTQLNAVMNQPGDYEGFSANYSGAGFSGMRFEFRGLSAAAFSEWVRVAQKTGQPLNTESYATLARPSERDAVRRYSTVDASLYNAILNQCVASPCMASMTSSSMRASKAAN
jgi:cytochrome o ubiquinol oxidase subunit II